MEYIVIKNQNEVDEKAFTLIGASTKRKNTEAIGYFGSGYKYALSTLIKEDCCPEILSGTNKISVTTETIQFRDQCFNVICINGKQTGMTAESGPGWKFPDAVREIYANAIDEGEHQLLFVEDEDAVQEFRKGESGTTTVIIPLRTQNSQELKKDWDHYFLDKSKYKLATKTEVVELYEPDQKIYDEPHRSWIFREGMACINEIEKKQFFKYNFIIDERPHNPAHKINESRVLDYYFISLKAICEALWRITDEDVCERLLHFVAKNGTSFETRTLCMYLEENTPSGAWRAVIKRTKLVTPGILKQEGRKAKEDELVIPQRLYNFFSGEGLIANKLYSEKVGTFSVINKSEAMNETIGQACALCYTSFGIRVNQDDIIAARMGPEHMAITFDGKIIIAEHSIESGYKTVAKCIIEEWLHITTGAKDETYEMHHAYLDLLLSIASKMRADGIKLFKDNE